MIVDKVIGSGLEKEFIQFIKAHFGFDEATAKLIVEKIQKGEYSIENPEELKKLETEFKKFIKSKFELDVDMKTDVENQKDARNLAIQTQSKIPSALSVLITLGFFLTLGRLLTLEGNPSDTLLVMLGSLSTAWIAVVNYWFGSSSGSAYKNDLIEKMSKR